MTLYVAKRIATSAAVLATLTLLTFVLSRVVPSDPAVVYAGPKATPETLDRIREELGLDRSLPVQFVDYVASLLTGDLGVSLATKQPVLPDILQRLPSTLELIFAAMTLAAVLGVALGVVAARRQGGVLDGLIRFLCIGGISMPAFWLGLLLQVLVVGQLGLLHATGQFSTTIAYSSPIATVTHFPLLDSLLTGNWVAFRDGLEHLVLPALTLAAYPLGLIARMTRASMLEALDQDFTLTARAYGLSDRLITWKLTLKNAVSPTLTVLGLSIAYALTGTFFVEVVYNWPGIGAYATQAMLAVDYPVIMAITLLGAAGYLVTNLVVDLLQARLDPRMRS
ncbi:ABC transporter permease [Nocardioides sp. GCM10027113]|uniref:ABC transporter permease n=1 Tax=unclassified Nocardioides TaxID=2615069 RepID=UPI00361C6546